MPCPKCNDNGTVQVIHFHANAKFIEVAGHRTIKLAGELRERPCRWCPREGKMKGRRRA